MLPIMQVGNERENDGIISAMQLQLWNNKEYIADGMEN